MSACLIQIKSLDVVLSVNALNNNENNNKSQSNFVSIMKINSATGTIFQILPNLDLTTGVYVFEVPIMLSITVDKNANLHSIPFNAVTDAVQKKSSKFLQSDCLLHESNSTEVGHLLKACCFQLSPKSINAIRYDLQHSTVLK